MSNIIEGKDFTIENQNPTVATISIKYPEKPLDKNNYILLDFGDDRKVGDNTVCNLLFRSTTKKITSSSASCGCTKAYFAPTEDPNMQHLTIDYDTHKISKNVSKAATYFFDNGHTDQLKFNVVMNRI